MGREQEESPHCEQNRSHIVERNDDTMNWQENQSFLHEMSPTEQPVD